MFVRRNRNILARRYRADENNVAFVCRRRFAGFTLNKVYKPFAYSLNADCYKDFCVFDDLGRAMYMEFGLIDRGIFETIYTNKHHHELRFADLVEDIDRENEKYKGIGVSSNGFYRY